VKAYPGSGKRSQTLRGKLRSYTGTWGPQVRLQGFAKHAEEGGRVWTPRPVSFGRCTDSCSPTRTGMIWRSGGLTRPRAFWRLKLLPQSAARSNLRRTCSRDERRFVRQRHHRHHTFFITTPHTKNRHRSAALESAIRRALVLAAATPSGVRAVRQVLRTASRSF